MPVVVYGTMALPILLKWGKLKGWENFFDLYATIGTLMERGNILIYIGVQRYKKTRVSPCRPARFAYLGKRV